MDLVAVDDRIIILVCGHEWDESKDLVLFFDKEIF